MLSPRDLALTLMLTVLWGMHAPIMKIGVEAVDPLALHLVRCVLTGLIFLPFAGKLDKKDIGQLFLVSLFFVCLNLMFAHSAMDLINSNSFAVIIQIAQPTMLILAWIFFKEKFGIYTTAGIAVAFTGLIIVFGAPDIEASPLGGILCMMGAICWSIGSISMKKTQHIKPATFLAYAYLMAVPISFLGTYTLEDNQIEHFLTADPLTVAFVIFYQVVMMGLMTVLWARLLARNTTQFVTPFLMLQPIVAVIGGYFMLGETLNMNVAIGGASVIAGLLIINVRAIQKKLRG